MTKPHISPSKMWLKRLSSRIFQEFPDGILMIDQKTRIILDANPMALRMFQYKKADMVGMDVCDIYPADKEKQIKKTFQQIRFHKSKYYCDRPCVRKNGEIFFVDIDSFVMKYAGRLVTIEMFRERSRMKQDATAWNSIYEHLAEMVGHGVCLVYEKKIEYANQAFADMLGATSTLQVIGKKMTDFMPANQVRDFEMNYEIIVSGIKPDLTIHRRFRKLDGNEISVMVRTSRVLLHGKWTAQAIFSIPGSSFKDSSPFVAKNYIGNKTSVTLLTNREIEILRFLASGKTIKEISNRLNIAVRTVTTHKYNLMSKLKFHTMCDLVRFAIENHICIDQ